MRLLVAVFQKLWIAQYVAGYEHIANYRVIKEKINKSDFEAKWRRKGRKVLTARTLKYS